MYMQWALLVALYASISQCRPCACARTAVMHGPAGHETARISNYQGRTLLLYTVWLIAMCAVVGQGS